MKIKTLLCCSLALACALSVSAQRRSSSRSGSGKTAREAAQEKMDAKVRITQMPNIGPQSLLVAPSLQAQGGSQPITKSRRLWGVYEMTYETEQKWTEDITVNWFVLCDTKKAKQVDRSKTAARLPPYVYYTLTSRYVNVPNGPHRSCVCLPPSFIERYGEPVVISCELVTAEGKLLDGATVVNGFSYAQAGQFNEESKEKMEWWNNDSIINAKDKNGEAMIEIRQGLIDRSKSPFYLVNNADYEIIQ